MKQRAVFLFYHGLGHVNSFLKAARILEKNNHEVWFAGSGYFREHIALQGCKFYLLKSYPFGLGLEKWINTIEGKNKIYFRTIWDRITDKVLTERQAELYWMLEELKPSLVFIDKMLSTDFIVLYPHLTNKAIRIAMINTMLPTEISMERPPLNSDVLPTDSTGIRSAIQKARLDKVKNRWKQKLMMLGFDDEFMISRGIKKNSIPRRYVSVADDLLNFVTEDLDEFILAPREFDFRQSINKPNQKYIGFMPAADRVEKKDKVYEELAARMFADRNRKNIKLIYCSFGTITPKQRNATAMFIEKLASIAATGEFIFVVSGESDQKFSNGSAANFYTFRSVPQLEVLQNTDVFITHGGLNSIKEAVYAEVPMLVYPVHPRYDPRGNAARIYYHGLGLRGDPVTQSMDSITSQLRELSSNETYRENIRRLKKADTLYTETSLMDAIDRIKPLE